jgi:serine/threonine protein kinase/Tfp pilus assembly protein PilF
VSAVTVQCPKCRFENAPDSKFCKECGSGLLPPEKIPSRTETLEMPAEELPRGTVFAGRYEIIEELGKGGMGSVYRVLDRKLNEEVALKLIKPEISSDRGTIERFGNELKLARKISHKNVGRMYHLSEDKGAHYITMEYIPGEDLKSFIRRARRLDVGTAVSIAGQVSEGLAEAHRLGVVHRDLKPSNIMIDKDGNARIMDFGIARSLQAKGITDAGIIIGTPEYMSPEQAEAREVDQRSDIYSLGVILYEMVTGRIPFEGETPLSVVLKHRSEMPKNPRELNPQVPLDLSRLILKCLEKEQEKRYGSAEELRGELEKIERGIPTAERAVPTRKPFTSKEITVKFQLKKLLMPALGIAALAGSAFIVWRFLPRKQPAPPPSAKPSLAVLYFENISGDQSLDWLKTGLTDLLITKLSQSKFITVIDQNTIYSILRKLNLEEAKKYSKEDLIKVANEGTATYTLSGSLMKAGKTTIVTLSLQKPQTGEVISSPSIECQGEEEIFPKVDELARTIKSDLKLTPNQIATDTDKELGKITTSSPAAFRLFSEGIRANWRGDFRQSVQLLQEAVAIDPLFASAYRVMGNASNNLGLLSQSKINFKKAAELVDRTSDRERLQILGDFYRTSSDKTYDKAIGAYEELLRLYPDDHIGNSNLGIVYFNLEEWDKALERFSVAYKTPVRYRWYSAAYMAQGKYDKSAEILGELLLNSPISGLPHFLLAQTYLCQGKLDQASVEIDKALALGPANSDFIETRGDVYQCQGDLSGAQAEYQKLLRGNDPVGQLYGLLKQQSLHLLWGQFGLADKITSQGVELARKIDHNELEYMFHLAQACICLSRSKPDKALRECDEAWRIGVEAGFLSLQARAMHIKGIACALANSPKAAEQAADEIRTISRTRFHEKETRRSCHLAGWMEQKKNNLPEAIKQFEQSKSLLPSQYYVPPPRAQRPQSYEHAFYLEPLAEAYYRAGQLEKAKNQYEEIVSLTVGRLYFGDLYAKSFYMLGKIADQQGDKARAADNYRKFLDLWKDADPGLPEVPDARGRLASLSKNKP